MKRLNGLIDNLDLATKLLVVVFIGILGPMGSQAIFEYQRRCREVDVSFDATVNETLTTLTTSLEGPLWNFSSDGQILVERLVFNPIVKGIVVYDSNMKIFANYSSSSWNMRKASEIETHHTKVTHNNRTIGFISVHFSLEEKTRQKYFIAMEVMATSFLSICATLFFVFLLIRYVFLSKILRLRGDAEKLRKREMKDSFHWNSGDELNEIGVILDEARATLTGLFDDIDRRNHELSTLNQELEKRVEERSKQAEEAARLASLSEMACGIAHEINNPLAIISAKSRKIRRLCDQGQVEKNHLQQEFETIDSTILRISKIINGLRTFSRNGSTDPFENTTVKSILDDALALCHVRFRSHEIDLRLNAFDYQMAIACRPVQLGQVVLNLLNNSFDAIESLPKKWVELNVQDLGNEIEISVKDSGAGVPEEVSRKLMEPFFTTKAVGKGTGLGLSISKGIIDAHQGTLYYDKDSKNTRFVIRLPKSHSLDDFRAA